jgi:hypothetical protein
MATALTDSENPPPAKRRRFLAGWKLPLALVGLLVLMIWGMVDSERCYRQVYVRWENRVAYGWHVEGGFGFSYEKLPPDAAQELDKQELYPQGIGARCDWLRQKRWIPNRDGTDGHWAYLYIHYPRGIPYPLAIILAFIALVIVVWKRVAKQPDAAPPATECPGGPAN